MRILLIVPAERTDWYDYLALNEVQHEYMLLWQEKVTEEKISIPPGNLIFSQVFYWQDYVSPAHLLRSVQPDKIIFFEIIDLRQIALIVTAKAKNIRTFYLEHGAAGNKEAAISRWSEVTFRKHKIPYLYNRFRKAFGDVLSAKLFYYAVSGRFTSFSSYRSYFLLPFRMMTGSPNKVLGEHQFPERIPDYGIVFNRINYEEFALYTGLPVNNALFTGVPFFDKYYRPDLQQGDHVVFIDHPYLEEQILGWTADHHKAVAAKLFRFAESRQQKMIIKLHPRSDRARWESYERNSDYVQIEQQGDFTEQYLTSKLILGFSSSLITGFLCAHKNVVLLGWHPQPHIFGMDFSQTGLCHVSFDPADLEHQFDEWEANNRSIGNAVAYAAYLHECNEPFDGNARRRIHDAINTL